MFNVRKVGHLYSLTPVCVTTVVSGLVKSENMTGTSIESIINKVAPTWITENV